MVWGLLNFRRLWVWSVNKLLDAHTTSAKSLHMALNAFHIAAVEIRLDALAASHNDTWDT
eukprot:4288494-Amphidinium_carterae.1